MRNVMDPLKCLLHRGDGGLVHMYSYPSLSEENCCFGTLLTMLDKVFCVFLGENEAVFFLSLSLFKNEGRKRRSN